MLLIPHGSAARDVNLPAYGVHFKLVGKFDPSLQHWTHTFVVDLPSKTVPTCDSVNCLVPVELRKLINKEQDQLSEKIMQLHEHINHSIPTHTPRNKRAPLEFIGDASSYLFGTARQKDLQEVIDHVNELISKNTLVEEQVNIHSDELSSIMKISSSRIDNMKTLIEHDHEVLENLITNMQRLPTQMITQLNYISNLHDLISSLSENRLNPKIITFKLFKSILNKAQAHIDRKFPSVKIVPLKTPIIYQNCHAKAVIYREQIYISVKIPITNLNQMLDLYRIQSYPVPIHANSTNKHATLLSTNTKYLALQNDYYLTLSEHESSLCFGDYFYQCSSTFPTLTHSINPSCESSLILSDHINIDKYCTHHLIKTNNDTKVVELSPNQFSVINLPISQCKCKHTSTIIQACNHCILQIPCGCALQNAKFQIGTRINHCHFNESTQLFPINAAIIHTFFPQHLDLLHNHLDQPLEISLPDIKIYKTKFEDQEKEYRIDLKTIKTKLQNNEVIYPTLTDQLIHINDSKDLQSYLIDHISTLLSVISLILASISFHRYRKITQMVAMIPATKADDTINQISKLSWKPTQIPITSPYTEDQIYVGLHIITIAISITTLLILTYQLINKFRRSLPTFNIILADEDNCVIFPVFTQTNFPTTPLPFGTEPKVKIFLGYHIYPAIRIFHKDVNSVFYAPIPVALTTYKLDKPQIKDQFWTIKNIRLNIDTPKTTDSTSTTNGVHPISINSTSKTKDIYPKLPTNPHDLPIILDK